MPRTTLFAGAALLAGLTGTICGQQSPEGPAMVLVRGPVSVRMGSPASEIGRLPGPDSAAEPQHTVRIPRSFAISTTEVTVARSSGGFSTPTPTRGSPAIRVGLPCRRAARRVRDAGELSG